jgi:hypothetical protein
MSDKAATLALTGLPRVRVPAFVGIDLVLKQPMLLNGTGKEVLMFAERVFEHNSNI